MVKIYIDAGHGGGDPGAVGFGLKEKDLTLEIAKNIRNILQKEYENVKVKMSRTKDVEKSLDDRTNEANSWGADLFLSIHINAGRGTGYEDFIYTSESRESKTRMIQESIHAEVMKVIDIPDRGLKQADLHVLRESKMPAILTESGFIDQQSDAEKLKNIDWLEKVARGHANGIVKSFKLKKKEKSKRKSKRKSTASKSKVKTHTIKKGETLWSIAKQYGTTVEKLEGLNPNVNPNALQIGSKIIVSGSNIYHTVKKGDSVAELSAKYGSTIKEIKQWNNLQDVDKIFVGQKLRVK